MQHIPQADLNEFLSDEPARKAAFVQQIGEAFQEIGFLALKGHFLDAVLQEQLYREIRNFFELPPEIKNEFSKSDELYFDIKKEYLSTIRSGESSKKVLERSIIHHAKICIENSEDVYDSLALAKMLGEEIDDRINRYSKCISKSTHNFITWLKDDYRKKLNSYLRANFDEVFEKIHGYPPEDE